jgi:hypothetical protein
MGCDERGVNGATLHRLEAALPRASLRARAALKLTTSSRALRLASSSRASASTAPHCWATLARSSAAAMAASTASASAADGPAMAPTSAVTAGVGAFLPTESP